MFKNRYGNYFLNISQKVYCELYPLIEGQIDELNFTIPFLRMPSILPYIPCLHVIQINYSLIYDTFYTTTHICVLYSLALLDQLIRFGHRIIDDDPRQRCSELCTIRRHAAVCCRYMALLKMVCESKVPRRSPIQLFMEPNLG